jgi:hypothetical protein
MKNQMEHDNKINKNRLVSPDEVVKLYWSGTEVTPASVRVAEGVDEQLVADFKDWYASFQEIVREEEANQSLQDRDVYPPEEFIIAALLRDYESRNERRAARRTARRQRFESLARSQLGRDIVYREGGGTLFVAKLLRADTNEKGLQIRLRILAIEGLTFVPPIPVCEITEDGEFTVNAEWDSFYFDELRWHEPYVDWNLYLSDAALARLRSEAHVLANASPSQRFSRLDALLTQEVRVKGTK